MSSTTVNQFSEQQIRVLRWAVMVAADAVTIKSSTGEMEQDDANHMIELISDVEDRINTLLAE